MCEIGRLKRALTEDTLSSCISSWLISYNLTSNDRPILFLIRSPYVDKQHFSITYLHPTNIGEEAIQVTLELFKCDEKGFMNLVKCFRPIRLLYYYIFLLIYKLQIPRTVLVHVCKQ